MILNHRIILHVDLDCFFAAIEARDNESYRHRPLIIGADPRGGSGRGVVSTCSYEARAYGLHSGMSISRAYKKCPHGIYIQPTFKKYKKASRQVMAIIESEGDSFQQASIDEAYLDATESCEGSMSNAMVMARRIKDEVLKRVGITCSIGIAPTKVLAKICCNLHKPNGITILKQDEIKAGIGHLDIEEIPGIGKKTSLKFRDKGINTIGDIISMPKARLIYLFGKHGKYLHDLARGVNHAPVVSHRTRKSISKERTFPSDVEDRSIAWEKLVDLNEKLHADMARKNIQYKTISLKVRFEGFDTYTRASSLSHVARNPRLALQVMDDLFKEFRQDERKIRLVGLRFSNLEVNQSHRQTSLWEFCTAQVEKKRW
ncbi:DNA polymerase IV [Candidatus Bathyarchaeota archaeon]|nr:DNA polymerase IV [Candidatus Bathyarchaeota archaeon]